MMYNRSLMVIVPFTSELIIECMQVDADRGSMSTKAMEPADFTTTTTTTATTNSVGTTTLKEHRIPITIISGMPGSGKSVIAEKMSHHSTGN